jgi:MYXO-CTERM domain-containing protein
MRLPYVLALSSLLLASTASAQIVIGPYTFPDATPFADTASFVSGTPSLYPSGVPTSVTHALTGYSPGMATVNMGLSCGTPDIAELGFTDVRAINLAGPDIVVFDSRFSTDDYEIAVRPVGGAFTTYRLYPATAQTSTGASGPPGSTLWGNDVDLSDFGLAPGTMVDAVRVKADCATNPDPSPELDLTMAAVLSPSGGCSTDADCDDGNECTADACVSTVCTQTPEPEGTPCTDGVCDGATSPACVECTMDVHCAAPEPRCDVSVFTCVGCLDAADCDDANECTDEDCVDGACDSVALPIGTPCTDGRCNGSETMPLCAECLSDADCGEIGGYCGLLGTCVECTSDAHCDDRDECTTDSCDELDGLCRFETVAGCRPDGGPPVLPDAGMGTADGGTGGGFAGRRGGCCATAPGAPSGPLGWLLVVVGVGLVVARRRARR